MNIVLWALVFGLLYVVLQKAFTIMRNRRCLDDNEIIAYREGKLKKNSSQYEHVIGHLGGCEKCQKRMTDFNE